MCSVCVSQVGQLGRVVARQHLQAVRHRPGARSAPCQGTRARASACVQCCGVPESRRDTCTCTYVCGIVPDTYVTYSYMRTVYSTRERAERAERKHGGARACLYWLLYFPARTLTHTEGNKAARSDLLFIRKRSCVVVLVHRTTHCRVQKPGGGKPGAARLVQDVVRGALCAAALASIIK